MLQTEILQAERALATLAGDPQQLDHARRRFSASPPFKKSPTPGSTRSQSSTPPTPGQVRRKLEIDERCRRQFSRPARQLSVQTAEQHGSFFRLFDAQPKLKHRLPPDTDYWLLAREIVKKHWCEQGIWNCKWDKETNVSLWRWKHEESETAAARAKRPPSRPAQRENLEQDREASRPFQQFLWQLVRQRDLVTGKPTIRKAAGAPPVDVNTVAYEAVKERWDRMGIWDTEWGVLPGMSWMHERPPEWTPQAVSQGAHAEEHSFAVAEVEAEAQRLFPKRSSPVRISERNGVTEPFDYRGLFDAASCSQLVNDNANKETGDAGLPSGYTINGISDGDSELTKQPAPLPTHPSPRVLKEPGPPIEHTASDNYHPLDDDAEYQRQVARLMDPFNVLKRKKTPQDISSTRQSLKAETPHELFHRSNVQERLAHKASTSAYVTQAAKDLSFDHRNTINTIGEKQGPGGRRRSKRIQQETAESNDHGRPQTNDELPPPSKRAKSNRPVDATRVKEPGIEGLRVIEPRRSARHKEQNTNGPGGRTTRVTTKPQEIAGTKPIGRRKAKARKAGS